MRYLLSSPGKRALTGLVGRDTLYAFDFDGTLAQIVRHHRRAGLDPQLRKWLRRLGKRAPTSIISGRSLEDLRRRVNGTVPYLIGNHGLEGVHASLQMRQEAKRTCVGWRRQLVEQRHEQFERLGVTVEDKRYSLSLHYRNAVRRDQAARIIRRAVEDLRPAPKMIRGKCVINLLPCRAPHKGEALLELMKKLNRSVALYIGDDDTDEDVFDLGDRRILTVRVGRKRSSAAKFFLRRQTEITAVLRYLVERWDASKKAVSGIRETGKLPVTASLPTLS